MDGGNPLEFWMSLGRKWERHVGQPNLIMREGKLNHENIDVSQRFYWFYSKRTVHICNAFCVSYHLYYRKFKYH